MRSFLDDIMWSCDAYGKGVKYANMAEKLREYERGEHCPPTSMITITFTPERHYPIRAHGGRRRR